MPWLALLVFAVIGAAGYVQLLLIAFEHERAKQGWAEETAWRKFLSMPRPKNRTRYVRHTLREAARNQGRPGKWTLAMAALYIAFAGILATGIVQLWSAL